MSKCKNQNVFTHFIFIGNISYPNFHRFCTKESSISSERGCAITFVVFSIISTRAIHIQRNDDEEKLDDV